MKGCTPGNYVNGSLGLSSPNPNLVVGHQYYLVSQETFGGDQWYDISPAIPQTATGTVSPVLVNPTFTVDGPVYLDNNNHYVLVPGSNRSYVGLQLLVTRFIGQ